MNLCVSEVVRNSDGETILRYRKASDEELVDELLRRDYGPVTLDCEDCVTAWLGKHEHVKTVWLYTGKTIDEYDAIAEAGGKP